MRTGWIWCAPWGKRVSSCSSSPTAPVLVRGRWWGQREGCRRTDRDDDSAAQDGHGQADAFHSPRCCGLSALAAAAYGGKEMRDSSSQGPVLFPRRRPTPGQARAPPRLCRCSSPPRLCAAGAHVDERKHSTQGETPMTAQENTALVRRSPVPRDLFEAPNWAAWTALTQSYRTIAGGLDHDRSHYCEGGWRTVQHCVPSAAADSPR